MLNRVVLIGRLTRDGELRYTPGGTAVLQFTLAVDRPFKAENSENTDFIPIVVWRKLAESIAQYARKGRLTAVEGRIQVRSYDNNEGRKVYVTEVVADSVRFLDSTNRGNEERDIPHYGPKSNERGPFDDYDDRPIDISNDDLPF